MGWNLDIADVIEPTGGEVLGGGWSHEWLQTAPNKVTCEGRDKHMSQNEREN